MWLIRWIGRLVLGGSPEMRYCERMLRGREINLGGLRSGWLIFSEKEY